MFSYDPKLEQALNTAFNFSRDFPLILSNVSIIGWRPIIIHVEHDGKVSNLSLDALYQADKETTFNTTTNEFRNKLVDWFRDVQNKDVISCMMSPALEYNNIVPVTVIVKVKNIPIFVEQPPQPEAHEL